MRGWPAQKEHITTHNLFYSAVFGEEGTGIVDVGFRIVGEFMYIPDTRKDIDVEPPYTVLGDDTVVFFDFITPGNITSEDIERIEKYNQIRRKAIEEHLKRTQISEDFLDPEDIEWFDHCTILREDQYISHRSGSAKQRERLRELESVSSIATVAPGTSLSLEARNIRDGDLTELLEEGIPVPKTPPSMVYLTRDINDESLAVAICEEIVLGRDLSDSDIALNFEDIKSHFGRDIQYDQLENVFAYLRDIGTCRKRKDDEKYRFTKYDINNMMAVRNKLHNETVQQHLSSDGDTEDDIPSLSDFM